LAGSKDNVESKLTEGEILFREVGQTCDK